MIKISISVDDGSYDSFKNIYPLLKLYNLPATFNLIPGYIISRKEFIGIPHKPITWDELDELKNSQLIEIANHSFDHTNELGSLKRGRALLNHYLGRPIESPIGFASPESKMTEAFINTQKNALLQAGCAYVRTGLRIRTFKWLRILARKIARLLHFSWLYSIAYHDTLLDSEDTYTLYSVPIMKDTTLKEVKKLIYHAIHQNKNLILLFHRVLKPEENNHKENWYWYYGKFEKLLQYLCIEQTKGYLKVVKTRDFQTGEDG